MAVVLHLIGLLAGLTFTAGAIEANPVFDHPTRLRSNFQNMHHLHHGARAQWEATSAPHMSSSQDQLQPMRKIQGTRPKQPTQQWHISQSLSALQGSKSEYFSESRSSSEGTTLLKEASFGGMLMIGIILLCCLGCLMCVGGNFQGGSNSCNLACLLCIVLLCAAIFSGGLALKKSNEQEQDAGATSSSKDSGEPTPWWVYLVAAALLLFLFSTPTAARSRPSSQPSSEQLERQRQQQLERQRQQQLQQERLQQQQALLRQIWVMFFEACYGRGMLEIKDGRLSKEWVEEVDPRVIIALPSIVILQCIFDSNNSDGVVLPDGTEVTSKSVGSLPVPREVSDRLLAAKAEFQKVGKLSDLEREYLEMKSLQVEDVAPLEDQERQARLNRAASTIEAAATSVTQSAVYSTMEQVLTKMQNNL